MNQMAANGDPVHRENVRAYRPFLPAMVEDDGDHGNNLHQHLEFAQVAGLDGEAFRGGDGAQPTDQKFARDNDHRDPGRDQAGVELNQRDEGGGDEELVGQGIEQDAHGRDLVAAAGEISVDAVGDGGGNKQSGGQQFLLAAKSSGSGSWKAARSAAGCCRCGSA